ncbi:MAG: M24 family metallopeptidase [Woeseia sp.]
MSKAVTAQYRPRLLSFCALLIFALACAYRPVVAEVEDAKRPAAFGQHSGSALERERHEWAVKKEKMDRYLRSAMRRQSIDMWVILSREFNPDPLLELFGGLGTSGWYGHRNAYIFRDPGGDQPLETVIFGTHQSGHMRAFFERIEVYGQEGLAPHLRTYIRKADPEHIAVNRSRTVAMADGLSAELEDYLSEAIGNELSLRLVSSEALVFDYVGTRTPAELAIETEASWRTWNILRRAFSNEVITPGQTRLMDVWGWIVDEWKSQHLDFNFPPSLTIYRRGEEEELSDHDNPVIQPGDLVHVDFGVKLMGLVTDQQHIAYVLHPGETEPPQGLRQAFEQSQRVAEIYVEELQPERTGVMVKEIIERRARQEGIDALVYGHTQGNWVHDVGARTVFNWPERYGIFAIKPVGTREFWSIEFRITAPIPEWDGQKVPIPREEDAWIDEDGKVSYITGPQEALWLIRSERRPGNNGGGR